ncbi:MAG: glyoxalase/bleomycin resistance/dioxygenase family protein [Rhodospirillaceae bacterium]|nr:glyoxalase/bleomycin resistance/dioxygenase family protein [Rhodospirillaceae bacterium]
MGPCLTHIALHVRDLDACVAFYSDYCGLERVHVRDGVVWLAEPGRQSDLILVLLAGGPGHERGARDYGHLGFALDTRTAVDDVAARAAEEGRLIWPPRDEPYPTGYYCGVSDPDGNAVEFSYGQPLGPGAQDRP